MAGRIGKYTVERELGQGGFGKVYLAFDPDVGQYVAIKKLLAQGDPDLLKRFQLEIRTTASLRHKNIVTIHASGEDQGDPYLVMEFLEGYTLKQIVQQGRPLSLLDRVRIMTQVADGLAYAHSKGVVHRDVKPENIMLLPDDNVKIMDFGIALGPNRNTAVTQTGGIIGTPPYFAPEQLEGFKATEQTDIFSFGDVYYELLTGVHPFEQYKGDWRSLQIAIMSYEPKPLSELVPGCPEALETLVHRTLAKEPEFRYQRFEEVQLDSEAILVDLKHEDAAAILREVIALKESGNLQTALSKINQAYQLDPGNREVRRLREEINVGIQREQVQARVANLLETAEKQLNERRYAEAVQTLESAAKLDSTKTMVAARLEAAKALLENSVRASRLISEARYLHQKGLFAEEQDRLRSAIVIDPEHTEARRMLARARDQQRDQAIRAVREHLAGRRFDKALEVLEAGEKQTPDAALWAELRGELLQAQTEEARRQQTERYNLALIRTRETMQAGDLELAGQMLDHLAANFTSEPGADEALGELRGRLRGLTRAREIAQYQERVRALVDRKSHRAALELVNEALLRFPDEAGLERLRKSARSAAIAEVLKEATTNREAGKLEAALDAIAKGRQEFGDEAAFADLARLLAAELEQQRYNTALESFLREGGELVAAGRYGDAIDRLGRAGEFSGEARVRILLDSARAAKALEEERRFVDEILSGAGKLEAAGKSDQALKAVEQALPRYSHNTSLMQAAERLRGLVALELRHAAIEKHRTKIGLEIQKGDWKRAETALRKARAEFPGEAGFDDLAAQVESGLYEDGWRAVAERVNQHLAANTPARAKSDLDDQRTLTLYANDPRWKSLVEEVNKRKGYEDALSEADRKRNEGRLSEAEELLTKVINHGPPDQRADQKLHAIQVQRSETLRQQEISRIAQEIGEHQAKGDLAQAESRLAAARARYPGESAWDELQGGLDALRRQARIAAVAEELRRTLAQGEVKKAAAGLAAARTRYPGESVWGKLDEEIKRRQQIAAAAESIRGLLSRDQVLPAAEELGAARARYPGEPLWNTLQAEIEARRAALDAETAKSRAEVARMGESIRDLLQRGELRAASENLAAARKKYPQEAAWAGFQAEIAEAVRVAIVESEARIRESLQRDDIAAARAGLEAARQQHPGARQWDGLQAEIVARQSARERETEIARLTGVLRGMLERDAAQPPEAARDKLRRAGAQLEQARKQYPGEAVWTAQATELAARQSQIEREIAEAARVAIAESEARIRARLNRDDVAEALTALEAARRQHPGARQWDELQAEIVARQGARERETEIARLTLVLRGMLERDAGQPIEAARDKLRRAGAQLEQARKQYPGEAVWAALATELAARQSQIEREIAEAARVAIAESETRIRACLARDDIAAARAGLDAARQQHPGMRQWDELQAEIVARQSARERETEIARLTGVLRGMLERDAAQLPEAARDKLRRAGAQLEQARKQYPGESVWTALATELSVRQSQLEREIVEAARVAIAESEARIRACLNRDDVAGALTALDAARQQHPGARQWDGLKTEIEARRAILKRQEEVNAAERTARQQLDLVVEIAAQRNAANPIELQWDAFQKASTGLAEARAKYRDEARLTALQSETAARRGEWQKEVAGSVAEMLRSQPNREAAQWFGSQIRSLRTKDPKEPLWKRLAADIDALDALLKRQAEEEQRALEEQRRREVREAARGRLLAIEQQLPGETRKKKRKELEREAQSVAAGYAADQEIAAIAARIGALVEVPAAEATQPTAIPWKLIGGGVGAAAVVTAGLVIGLHKKTPVPPPPPPVPTVSIEIRTDPAGALVHFGNRSCQTPDCHLDMAPGSYPVDAQLKDYQPLQQTVVVSESNRLVDLRLVPVPAPPPAVGVQTGTLVVRAGVPDALVYIDGTPQSSRTDQSGSATFQLEAKAHEVRVERNDYEKPEAKQVKVRAEGQQSVLFHLTQQSSRLELTGAPANLALQIDGATVSRFPASVKPGVHTLAVTQGLLQAGQGTASRSVTQTFAPNQTVLLAWKPETPGVVPAVPAPGPKLDPAVEEEERDWKAAQNSADPAPLRDFVKKHPNSKHNGEAQSAIDRLESTLWSKTNTDNLGSLRAYLSVFPGGAHAPEANSHIDDLAWKGVDQGKLDQVRDFVDKNPNSRHVADARGILDRVNAAQANARKQVADTLSKLGVALRGKKEPDVRAIWPDAAALLKSPRTTFDMQCAGDPVITGDQASASCTLTTTVNRDMNKRAATLMLRNHSGQWQVEKVNYN